MISRDQTYLYKNEEHKDVFDNSIVPHYGMHVHQPILIFASLWLPYYPLIRYNPHTDNIFPSH